MFNINQVLAYQRSGCVGAKSAETFQNRFGALSPVYYHLDSSVYGESIIIGEALLHGYRTNYHTPNL